MKYLVFLFSFLTLAACTNKQVDLIPAGEMPSNSSVVIFLHGYYGSALVQPEENKIYYPGLKEALIGRFPIALESHQLSLPSDPNLVAAGTIGKVVVIPGLYEIDVYEQGIQNLGKDLKIYSFSYDWRTDLFSVVQDLDIVVQELKDRGNSVSLLAHSMGGLVASYYLAYGPKEPHEAEMNWGGARLIDRAVFLGTPFNGSVSIFRNMIYGTGYTWNEDALSALSVSSFASSYFLLPFKASIFETTNSNAAQPLPLASAEFWKENKIGLAAEQFDEAIFKQRFRYMETKLLRANSFVDLLFKQGVPPAKLRILNVVGKGRSTLARGFYSAEKKAFALRPSEAKELQIDFSKLEEDGDSSVPMASAQMPPAFASVTEVFPSGDLHDRLMDSSTTRDKILDFLKRKDP